MATTFDLTRFNRDRSAAVRLARGGEDVIIRPPHGKGDDLVLTRLARVSTALGLPGAAERSDTVLSALEELGAFTPAKHSGVAWPIHPGGPSYTSAQVDALLSEMKGDH